MHDKEAPLKDALAWKPSNQGVVAFHVGRHSLGPLLGFLLTKQFIPLKDDTYSQGLDQRKQGRVGLKLKLVSELNSLGPSLRALPTNLYYPAQSQ